MKKILVLCRANSCRSQMAEGYLKFFGGNKAIVSSAGMRAGGIHPMTITVMEEDNIDVSESTSKSVDSLEHAHFDYLVKVCNEEEIVVPSSISFTHQLNFDIPDPAEVEGTEQEKLRAFRNTREIVKKRMLKFIGQVFVNDVASIPG